MYSKKPKKNNERIKEKEKSSENGENWWKNKNNRKNLKNNRKPSLLNLTGPCATVLQLT